MGTVSGPHGILEAYYVKRFIDKKNKQEKKSKEKENSNKSR